MTMLILMRHAKAKAAAPTDHARELSQEGVKQALQAGEWLKQANYVPDFAIVSDAVRTKQTFEELHFGCEVVFEESAYNASSGTLMDLIRAVSPDCESLLLIAHNPGIADLGFALGHRRSVTPGSVVVVHWQGTPSQLGQSAVQITGTFSPSDD